VAAQREWFEKDYYADLGVSPTATPKEITTAYRRLARQFHPDANPNDVVAEEKFKTISAAYDVVGDAGRRKEYDGVRAMSTAGGGRGFAAPGGFRDSANGGDFGGADLGEMLGNLFGKGGGRSFQDVGASGGPKRGGDLETDLHLSFLDALKGVTTSVNLISDAACPTCSGSGASVGSQPRQCGECSGRGVLDDNQGFFSFSRPCNSCQGRGVIIDNPCITCHGSGVTTRPRVVKVRLPEGVKDGQQIRLKGKGTPGKNGGPTGDLYVRVHVESHPLFSRDGENLTVTVPMTFPELALGADIKVPTVDGDFVTIRVPPGTPNGRVFRVKARGVASASGRGDLLISAELVVPTSLSEPERQALVALRDSATSSPRNFQSV
jgi:molecular chaperone DnaJ